MMFVRLGHCCVFLLAWLCVLGLPHSACAQEAQIAPHYATTRMLEPDRCATAWVITRYLHPNAVITFHDREDIPVDAILFDLPEADLKRDAMRATVEVLIEQSGLTDPFVLRLGCLVHDVEINYWATRREPGSRQFEAVIRSAIAETDSVETALATVFVLLDSLRAKGGDVERWGK